MFSFGSITTYSSFKVLFYNKNTDKNVVPKAVKLLFQTKFLFKNTAHHQFGYLLVLFNKLQSRTYTFQLLGLTLAWGVYWSGALFTVHSQPPSRLVTSLYAATHHAAFGLGLAFIFISWTLGHKSKDLSNVTVNGLKQLFNL